MQKTMYNILVKEVIKCKLRLSSGTYLHLTKEYPFHLAWQSWGDFQPLRPGGRLTFPSSKGLSINSGINWLLCLCSLWPIQTGEKLYYWFAGVWGANDGFPASEWTHAWVTNCATGTAEVLKMSFCPTTSLRIDNSLIRKWSRTISEYLKPIRNDKHTSRTGAWHSERNSHRPLRRLMVLCTTAQSLRNRNIVKREASQCHD